MAGVITNNFRMMNTKHLYEKFSDSTPDNIYLFIARSTPWSDDTTPPQPVDCIDATQFSIWDNMLSLKKILPSDVTYAISRNTWKGGTVYSQYSSDLPYYNTTYYVITSNFNVYKILDNNNGAASTVQPTATSNTAFFTTDGYKWKFMYQVSSADVLKFLTPTDVPVKTLTASDNSLQWTVQQSAVNGTIDRVSVVNGGANYHFHKGNAQSQSNTSVIQLAASANAAQGYFTGGSVYILSGTGSGQIRNVTAYDGSSRFAHVSPVFTTAPDTTSVYNIGPRVTFSGDGTGTTAYANSTGGALNTVNIIAPGHSWTHATVTFGSNGASGAIANAQISPIGGHGSDAVNELSAHNILLDVKLTGDESNTFMTQNDYRTFGLVLNPVFASNGTVANTALIQQTWRITVGTTTSSFGSDEIVVGSTSNATGYVVQYNDVNDTVVQITGVTGTFVVGETITGKTTAATGVISAIAQPQLRKYSGEVIYMENRTPIIRDPSQTEEFRFVIRF